MNQQEEIRLYLERYRGSGEVDSLIIRAGNALLRYNISTMAQVAELSDEKIIKMRNVGVKTKAFIIRAAEDYRREQAQAQSK